jgi:hypothetical protein
MLRRLLLPVLLFGIVLAFASAGNAKGGALKGEVYGNALFKIELKGTDGKDLKTIKAGTYTIKVEDKATLHDFHLKGPGVDKSTSVPGTGDKTWLVTLKRGTYTYVCDSHATQMRGTFKVTS